MFFVAGITGQVGGATARHLLARGKQIRALVRDPQKAAIWSQKGVEVQGGDLNDVNRRRKGTSYRRPNGTPVGG